MVNQMDKNKVVKKWKRKVEKIEYKDDVAIEKQDNDEFQKLAIVCPQIPRVQQLGV